MNITSVTATNEKNDDTAVPMESFSDCMNAQHTTTAKKRRKGSSDSAQQDKLLFKDSDQTALEQQISQWKRIMLLVVAITVHNIPEGSHFINNYLLMKQTENGTKLISLIKSHIYFKV